jgi:alkylation response protein AidB-like acyl-CoA dehydrogenase
MTVDFNPDAEQLQVIGAIEEMLAERFPLARFRNVRGGDHDSGAAAALAALGWLGLGVAEADGGAGLSLVEEVAMFRVLGRHLATPNVLASVLGIHAAVALGRPELAAGIMGGEARVCLANALRDGEAHAIYDGTGADHVLHWNAAEFACVPAARLGTAQPGHCLDRTVALARAKLAADGTCTLSGASAQLLRARAELLMAAQLLGIAEAALATAVDYAKLRQQFGQPIGAFQAIKHRCADMKLRVDVLASLVTMAALAAREGLADAPVQIAAARLLASRYALENAAAGIQIHGAMGFTAECDAHLFLLRAHLLDTLGGTAAAREAELAGLPA